jgi:hypothetical protein
MKIIYTFTLVCLYCITLKAQTPHPAIKQFLIDMKDDSVLNNLKELSGEKTCVIKGQVTTIKNRVSKNGNDLAADYLKERMQAYGFTVTDQKYSTGGRNIIAEQRGTLYPDKKFVIGAHYDSMADYCADDNASGCSAMLEVVRILSKHKFKYTIIYGFWDEEEQGLFGSAYFAKQLKSKNENIMGALNMDMIGYDSNSDTKFEIHTKAGGSLTMANKLQQINTDYAFKLSPIVKNPGTDRSDHASFWAQGYSAIHFSEAFFSGDGNPNYHKSTDRINMFNLPYFYQLSRLSLSAIATFAEPYDITGIDTEELASNINLQAYPNPARESVTINYELQESTALQIRLYNPLSAAAQVVLNQTESAGVHQHVINTDQLASGVYFIVMTTNSQTYSSKIVIEK